MHTEKDRKRVSKNGILSPAQVKTLLYIGSNPGTLAYFMIKTKVIKSSPNDIYPALKKLTELKLTRYDSGTGRAGQKTKKYYATTLGVFVAIHYGKSQLGLEMQQSDLENLLETNGNLFPRIMSVLKESREQIGFRNHFWEALSDTIDPLVTEWSFSLDSSGRKTRSRGYDTLVESDFIHEVARQAVESLIFAAGETDYLRDLHIMEMSRALLAVFKEEFGESITEYQNELDENNRQLARIRTELGFE